MADREALVPRRCDNTHKDPKAFASLIHDVGTKIFGTRC
ncbi:hypothetical protein HDC93_002448 [Streptomyces sp. AK010]|nr:hypothetical protein [Streptomyces sp. AK010]